MISYYGSGWKKDVVSQCLEFDQDLVSTCRSAPQGGRSGVVSLRVRIVVVVDRFFIYIKRYRADSLRSHVILRK